MPTLIPPVTVDTIEPYSEQQVIAALVDQLPKECKLYHNFEYVTPSASGNKPSGKQLLEGEIDAVILWPDKGLLVLEIKGGEISYCADSDSWQSSNRNGVYAIKDPLSQARHNLHSLVKAMEGELNTQLKGALTHGYAVVFPTSRAKGSLPHSADTAIVCDASRMDTIGRFVEGALKSWRRRKHSGEVNRLSIEQLHKAMLPVFNLVPSLKSRVAGDNEQLLRLTQDQRSFLTFAEELTRARVDGVAGSGKTLLAVEQARRYANAGKRTLFLCYNKSLAAWIRGTLKDDEAAAKIEVRTFHDFCAHACNQANIAFSPNNADTFWSETSAELLSEASHLLQPFDAIVVDEGQDFRETWWLAIEDCLAENSRLMVFCDPQQNIFGADGLDAIDVGDRILRLPVNCRNTQRIARFCDDIINIESFSHERAPDGLPVTVEIETNDKNRAAAIKTLVTRWIKEEGLKPSQVAILSCWRSDKTCMADIDALGRTPLTDDIKAWEQDKGVLFTTIRAFKGLEADVLLLIDVPEPGSHPAFTPADYYVACSRAKSVLHVLTKEAAVGSLKKTA
jgi:hypothetical protein